jgi:ADP-heptose:LPS heptosyltransferase
MRIVRLPKSYVPKEEKKLSLKEILERQDKILVVRRYGGLGDIFSSRPLFKTIKLLYPSLHVTYAAPKQYHEVLNDHPYIDSLISLEDIDLNDYGYAVDISRDCGRYEDFTKPFVDKHRSDIWAEISLGIKLLDHDSCFQLDQRLKEEMKQKLVQKYRYMVKPKIGLVTKSASLSKDIEDQKVVDLVSLLKAEGLEPVIISSPDQKFLYQPDCLSINDLTLKELPYLFTQLDYILSVDTGAFHLAAALGIPTLGIFTWTDSKILSMYHPKVLLLQRHRDDNPGYEECPCWSWAGCKYQETGVPTIPLKCMKTISAQEIFLKLKELMERFPIED